ncbi:hypothetical protein SAMN04490244_106305 [Tranquillimonas rosea]|uniref:Uncharacterized protein n=1 Tax=Tranquillimonas rosea TaxID=641238 RepID=A0A1H9V7C4_9RHOB|nr:hypothetical protein [Tranquillimonas rosea]SES17572.1 hypothetical protein SAMN04490244_106305 [Tranquillimonas rosea]
MSDLILRLVAEYGPWVLLVFYLLFRDAQKEDATREALNKNTEVMIEMTTLIRERLPRAAFAR